MLLGAGVLGLQLLLTNYIDRRERGRRPPASRVKKANAAPGAERLRHGVQDAVPAADGD